MIVNYLLFINFGGKFFLSNRRDRTEIFRNLNIYRLTLNKLLLLYFRLRNWHLLHLDLLLLRFVILLILKVFHLFHDWLGHGLHFGLSLHLLLFLLFSLKCLFLFILLYERLKLLLNHLVCFNFDFLLNQLLSHLSVLRLILWLFLQFWSQFSLCWSLN